MTKEEIIEMARQAGLHVANDSEGHFSGVTSSEMTDMYPDPNKERDRLHREKVFIEVLAPFAELVAEKEREACAKLCDLAMLQNQETINELEEDEHIAQCFIQGAMTQLVKTSKAIRARGQE